jgi:hypothetical protein
VDFNVVKSAAQMISSLACPKTEYRQILDNDCFKTLYDVKVRSWDYIEAGKLASRSQPSVACMICGLVLPTSHVDIDHQGPKSGGEYIAVLKNFHVVGLTKEGPRGPKGLALLQYFKHKTAMGAVPTKPGRPKLGGVDAANRYTLNDEGAALYSFVSACGLEAKETLLSQCMNSLFNLRPACGPCNSSRKNPGKQFPTPMT